MKRGRREKIEPKGKASYLLYSILAVLVVMIITFVVTFAVYKSKLKNSTYSELTAEKIAELVPNEANSELEQASTDIGKTIEEVVKQIEETNNKVEEQGKEVKLEKQEESVQENENETTKVSVEPEVIKDPEFSMPVEGEISKNYAKDSLIYSETLQEWITHLGIDIKAERTTVVKAAEEGTVIGIKNDPRYGLTVIIEHVNGFKTIYSNLLTSEFVSEGDKVEKGQTIGTVGNSASFEIVDEPHLHFEIIKDDINVDPNIYLK